MNNLRALILAGGVGKRLVPLTLCKSLIPFCGKTIIRYVFDDLKAAGINDIKVICPPANIDQIKKSFLAKDNVSFYVQKKALGMADAVLSVPDLDKKPLIIVNADDLLEGEAFKQFVEQIKKTESQIILTGKYYKEYFPGGYFVLAGKKIKGLVEKPPKDKQPSNFIRLVLDYFKDPKEFINYLKKVSSEKDDIYEVALDKMIKEENQADLFEYRGYWQSIKYPWHILAMMKIILEKRMVKNISQSAQISPKSTIKGKVVIESGVKILEGVCILGPAYIGKNSTIGTNALVRESMIGDNCVVGFATEIARSWIGNNCWFHTNYIGDSVLQENVSFGSGAVTANLRLDEKEIFIHKEGEKINSGRMKLGAIISKNVRIGVNTSLMPGVIIGNNSVVGPGLVLSRNLEKSSACFAKQNLEIKQNNVVITCR
jgi:NDP-sugar pyrophosphorylase family protein